MTQIPEDILSAAMNVRRELLSSAEFPEMIIGRAILAERERCTARMAHVIKEGMAAIADELQNPSDETVKMVASAIRENPPEEIVDYDRGGNKFLDVDYEDTARAAITAVRGAFFNSKSPDQT